MADKIEKNDVPGERKEWICTDYDSLQYGRLVSVGNALTNIPGIFEKAQTWEYVQLDEHPKGGGIVRWNKSLTLADYDLSFIRSNVSGYYRSLEALVQEYPNDWQQLAIECIFEQMEYTSADEYDEVDSLYAAKDVISGWTGEDV